MFVILIQVMVFHWKSAILDNKSSSLVDYILQNLPDLCDSVLIH